MILNGIAFDFSPLNANHMDRLNTAKAKSDQASAREAARVQSAGITDMAEIIRGQCRIVEDFLDDVLGAGAAEKLGLNGSDFAACRTVMAQLQAGIQTELAALKQTQPQKPPRHHNKKRGRR